MLDAVSEFRAPGKLVLRAEKLRGELAALDQSATEPEAGAAPTKGASGSGAGKSRKRAASKGTGSTADTGLGVRADTVAGVENVAADETGGSAGHQDSKKRKKDKDAHGGQMHAKGRRTESGEPQVLNRQHVQPERPADPAAVWTPGGFGPAGVEGSRMDQHVRQGSGSGSGASPAARTSPPPVRWDLDVAAALGIGRGAAPAGSVHGDRGVPRGLSPSAASSGAWASTSFGGFPRAPPGRGSIAPHRQPQSRSLTAASADAPGDVGVATAALPHAVPRLKIRLRVPPGSKGVAAAEPSAGGSRRSSGSGGRSARTPYDDSWFAQHVGREPRLEFSIHDEAQVRSDPLRHGSRTCDNAGHGAVPARAA